MSLTPGLTPGLVESSGKRTDGGELGAVDAHHAQPVDLAAPPEVKHGQADDAHLLVRRRGAAADEAGCVLAGADLMPADVSCRAFWSLARAMEPTMRTLRGFMLGDAVAIGDCGEVRVGGESRI